MKRGGVKFIGMGALFVLLATILTTPAGATPEAPATVQDVRIGTQWLKVIKFYETDEPPIVQEVHIGILAPRGRDQCLKDWEPTAAYLSETIPKFHFSIVPLDFEEIFPAVTREEIDFILANPAVYVDLEISQGAVHIATIESIYGTGAYSSLGGLLFHRADRKDIKELADLEGKTLMAVDPYSLGGWQAVWREFHAKGIDPRRFFNKLSFAGTHDAVVEAVLSGAVDAGVARTGTLANMLAEGKISDDDFTIIHEHFPGRNELPFPHSTRVYPEWPMAKARQVPNELASAVTKALLDMPADSVAARAAHCRGWISPVSYQSVHDLMKELDLGYYHDLRKITPGAVIKKYQLPLSFFLVFFCGILATLIHILVLKKKIKKSYSELDQIFNSAADGMRVVGRDFQVLRINATMAAMTGFTPGQCEGRPCFETWPGLHCHTPQCTLNRIGSGEERVEIEIEKIQEGGTMPCILTAVPFRDPSGTVVGIIENFKDMTQWKKLERELLLQKQREAQQAAMAHSGRMAALGEMATAMAHEINQPLSVISLSLQTWTALLRRDTFNADQLLAAIPKAIKNVERISKLIEHVREFGRAEAKREAVDLNGVVREALSLCRSQLRNHGFELRENLADGLPQVDAVASEIEQVVLNLVANARHAVEQRMETTPGLVPVITVTTEQRAARVAVVVVDNGGGVPEEKEAFIFDPFFTTKPAGKGTGLGLHISLQIMEHHGGGLILHNHPGDGAAFEAWLPSQV